MQAGCPQPGPSRLRLWAYAPVTIKVIVLETFADRCVVAAMTKPPDDDRRPFALVVDDDQLILMDASSILADAGFRPLEASNVDKAERLLEEYAGEIVLLFTDVQMPGDRDGFALARLAAERWPDIGILVASGLANPEDGSMPPGAIFVRKPFHADLIFDRLQVLLPDGKKPAPLLQRTRQH